jgi:glycine dehydrogenase
MRACAACWSSTQHHGAIEDLRALATQVHAAGGLVVAATDLLALDAADAAGRDGAPTWRCGIAQRFGVPLGYRRPARGILQPRATSSSA